MEAMSFLTATAVTALAVLITAPIVMRVFRTQRLNELNVVSMMYFSHLLVAVIPALIFFTEEEREPLPLAQYFSASLIGLFCIPLGAFLADAVRGGVPRSFCQIPHDNSPLARRAAWRFLLFYFFVICLPLMIWYLKSSPNFTLKQLVSGTEDYDLLAEMRHEATAGQIAYILGISRAFLVPLLFVLIIGGWRLFHAGNRWIGIGALVLAFFHNAYSAAKTPVVQLLTVAAIYLIVSHPGRQGNAISPASRAKTGRNWMLAVLLVGVIGYPLFIFMLKPFGKNNAVSDVVTVGVLGRVMYRPANNSYYVFELIPTVYPHTYGMDIVKLAQFLDREPVMLKYLVSVHRLGREINAPPPTLGTFYAQFGWPGVVVGMTFVTFLFRILEFQLLSPPRLTIPARTFYAMLLYGVFRTNWGVFHSVFLTETIVPLFAIMGLWRCFFWNPAATTNKLAPLPLRAKES